MNDPHGEFLKKYNDLIEQINLNQNKLESLVEKELNLSNAPGGIFEHITKQKEAISNYINNPITMKTKDAQIGILYSAADDLFNVEIGKLIMERKDFYNVPVSIFTINDIDIEKNIIDGYYFNKGKFEKNLTTIPPIIYNTTLLSKPSSVKKIRQLRTDQNIRMINAINWFHQDILMDMLAPFHQITEVLLPYTNMNLVNLMQALNSWDYLFIVPRRHYSHPRIIIIEKMTNNKVQITAGTHRQIVEEDSLYFTLYKMLKSEKHLIFKGIPLLLQSNNLPIECRIYVQKDIEGRWSITSLLLKNELFSDGSIFDHAVDEWENGYKNELMIPLTKISEKLNRLPINLATYFDFLLPNVGSYYFDFLLTKNGQPFLIHIGGVEQFDYLARMNRIKWKIYLNKILDYSLHLLTKEMGKGEKQ